MDFHELKEIVKARLTMDRFTHSLRVMDTAVELAEIFGLASKQVKLACLLHDYAKCDTIDSLKEAIHTYNLPLGLLDYHHEVWHGPVGAMKLKHELGILDEDVYHAVYFHTTGREAMSMLELIVFVADYIEPARNFAGIEEVRDLARQDIRRAAHKALQNSMMFILTKGEVIHPDTLYAYNDLTNFIRSEN